LQVEGATLTISGALKSFLLDRKNVVVVGVGTPLRGDDGVGFFVAKRLQGKKTSNTVILPTTSPESVTGTIKKFYPSHVIIVDSAFLGEPPGTVRVVEREKLLGSIVSTHKIPLGLVMDYLEASTGCKTILVGVQPKNLGFGEDMSPEVRTAAEKLVETLEKVLAEGV